MVAVDRRSNNMDAPYSAVIAIEIWACTARFNLPVRQLHIAHQRILLQQRQQIKSTHRLKNRAATRSGSKKPGKKIL
jgi:hypothetical protein